MEFVKTTQQISQCWIRKQKRVDLADESRYFDTRRKGNHSSFLIPTVVGGRHPFRLKFALKMTNSLQKTPTSNSAYKVSTVRDSEKIQLWRIGSRSRAFQRLLMEWVLYQ